MVDIFIINKKQVEGHDCYQIYEEPRLNVGLEYFFPVIDQFQIFVVERRVTYYEDIKKEANVDPIVDEFPQLSFNVHKGDPIGRDNT